MTDGSRFKYLDLITGLFATLLIVSNLASTRIIDFTWGLQFDAGTLMFPTPEGNLQRNNPNQRELPGITLASDRAAPDARVAVGDFTSQIDP